MNEAMIPLLMIGGFLAVGFIIAWQSGKASKKAQAHVARLAERLGLVVTPATPVMGVFYPPPKASGTMRGKRVEVYAYTTGSGKSRKTWAAISATPSVVGGLTFSLTRQGLGTKVRSLFGAKEIQVGERSFDDRWFIQTNQPEFFKAALLPELRAKIFALDRTGLPGMLQLESGAVKYVEGGTFLDWGRCERFAAVVDVLCDLADVAEVWAERR